MFSKPTLFPLRCRVSFLITQPPFRISGKVNKIRRRVTKNLKPIIVCEPRTCVQHAQHAQLHLNLRSIYRYLRATFINCYTRARCISFESFAKIENDLQSSLIIAQPATSRLSPSESAARFEPGSNLNAQFAEHVQR